MYIFTKYDNILEIDASRQVIMDYGDQVRKRENIRQLENVRTGAMDTGTRGTKNLIVILIYNFSCWH